MEHLREDVEEILFRLAERAADDPGLSRRVVRAVRVAMRLAIWESRIARAPRLFDELKAVSVRWARWRAPRLRDALGIDVDDLGDLGRIQDWEDRLFQVEGHWVARDRCTAEKHETACPFSDLAALEPRICTEVVHELETETFRALNPRYRLVPLERLLSKGDAACVFRHELEQLSLHEEDAARVSADGAA